MIRHSEFCRRFRGLGLQDVPHHRRTNFMGITTQDLDMGKDQRGGGIIQRGLTKVVEGLTGERSSKIQNVLKKAFVSNPLSRPGFPGEKHVILPTKYGLTPANWAGPGTSNKRFARGDKGVDGPRGIDSISKVHDRDYIRARTATDIRRADNKMIAAVKRSSANPATKAVVLAGLKAKTFGEDVKIFDQNTFTKVLSDDVKSKPNVAVQGTGIVDASDDEEPMLPADRLLNRVLKKVKKRKRGGGGFSRGARVSAQTGRGKAAKLIGPIIHRALARKAIRRFTRKRKRRR